MPQTLTAIKMLLMSEASPVALLLYTTQEKIPSSHASLKSFHTVFNFDDSYWKIYEEAWLLSKAASWNFTIL